MRDTHLLMVLEARGTSTSRCQLGCSPSKGPFPRVPLVLDHWL